MSGKNYLKIRLTTQQLSFLHSNILCKIMVNDLLNNQNILKDIRKTYLKTKEDNAKNDEEEKRLELFESLNCTTDFRCQNFDYLLKGSPGDKY